MVLKFKHIAAIILSFLLTGFCAFYLLQIRYNSCLYSMMMLNKCYLNNDSETLKKYCSLKMFCDSASKDITEIIAHVDEVRKIPLEVLLQNKEDRNYELFYYNNFTFFKENFGEIVYFQEEKEAAIVKANAFYRPFSSGQNVKLELIFVEEKNIFQLQYIKNLKTFFTLFCQKQHQSGCKVLQEKCYY